MNDDENTPQLKTTPKPKSAKRLIKFVQPFIKDIEASTEQKSLRNQNKINYTEELNDSSYYSDEKDTSSSRGNQRLLKRKMRCESLNEHDYMPNKDNNSPIKTMGSKRKYMKKSLKMKKNKNTKKFKHNKSLKRYLNGITISNNNHNDNNNNNSDKEVSSYLISDNIEDEYDNNYTNISCKEGTRNEILETICTASKQISQYENEYFQLTDDALLSLKGYPKNCIPINANVQSFDFQSLIKKQLELTNQLFDVIVIDPPWLLSSSQPSRGVTITFETLSDEEIAALKIETLQTDGFIFIWTINGKFQLVFELLDKWGYTYCDLINWVKKTKNGKFAKGHGYYLQHTKETCIVGIKGNPKYSYDSENSDLIFSQRRGQSQKPNELYEKIEQFFPNGYYLELFGRRNNLRDNWITIGNEI